MNWDGLLLINKPFGTTSHTVVQGIKNRLRASKAGHLGTLDPIATGVFPVCLGKATRLAPFYMGADKRYLATFRFGFFTSTDDREGEQEGPMQKVRFSEKELEATLALFQGDYDQTPPAFSAKKIKGKKAYQIARRGMKPNLPSQKVKIYEIQMLRFEKDLATVSIHCGSGTYVRSIARDLGIRLKCGAHVKELVRTKFNDFDLEQCCIPGVSVEGLGESFIPIEKMLLKYPEIVLKPEAARRICTGSAVEVDRDFQEEWARILDQESHLIAMARIQSGPKNILQPKIVLS